VPEHIPLQPIEHDKDDESGAGIYTAAMERTTLELINTLQKWWRRWIFPERLQSIKGPMLEQDKSVRKESQRQTVID